MKNKNHERLLSDLFITNEHHNPQNHQDHIRRLLKYRFSQIFHFSDEIATPFVPKNERPKSIPAENEIRSLLSNEYRDLYLENILYHLHRNQLHLPPSLIPHLLTRFKTFPRLWHRLYRDHPDLILALATRNPKWEYMQKAFDPDFELRIGSPQFYESLTHRIRVFPEDTARWIRLSFPAASDHHKVRLLQVLSLDPHPDTMDYFISLLPTQKKAVRIIALRAVLRHKHPDIYEPLAKARFTAKDPNFELPPAFYRHFWKDLMSMTETTDKIAAIIRVIDPADDPNAQSTSIPTADLLEAALLHRTQSFLTRELISFPAHLSASRIIKKLTPASALEVIRQVYIDQKHALDQTFFDLLIRINPHLPEDMTDFFWETFKAHRADLTYYFDPFPLEVWGLRIHPNSLQKIWKDPELQTTETTLQALRDILKHRLSFLKKCYQS